MYKNTFLFFLLLSLLRLLLIPLLLLLSLLLVLLISFRFLYVFFFNIFCFFLFLLCFFFYFSLFSTINLFKLLKRLIIKIFLTKIHRCIECVYFYWHVLIYCHIERKHWIRLARFNVLFQFLRINKKINFYEYNYL